MTDFTSIMAEATEYGIAVVDITGGFAFRKEGTKDTLSYMYYKGSRTWVGYVGDAARISSGMQQKFTGLKGQVANWCLDIAAND